jgi:dUTP diphosphatase|nr:MAG TPA: dUTPase [Caudoviricetes sp.]
MKINCKFESKYGNVMDLRPQTAGSAGLDLIADIEKNITIYPKDSKVIPTGFYVEIPKRYVGLVFIRSSIGFKHDTCLANNVGVIDSDYRGEIKLKVINHNQFSGIFIEKGERIAQLVIVPYLQAEYVLQDSLDDTDRGEGGFGSTGKNRWEVIR